MTLLVSVSIGISRISSYSSVAMSVHVCPSAEYWNVRYSIGLLATLLSITAPILTNAQSIFDSLEDMDGVDMVVVTKDAFELISKFKNVEIDDNEGMKVFQMIQDLNEFKMFSTDNLDIASKNVLKEALKQFNGTLILVSHDRDFLRGLSKKVFEFKDQRVIEHFETIDAFMERNRIERIADINLLNN